MTIRKRRLIYFTLINITLLLTALSLVTLAKAVRGTPFSLVTDCPSHIIFGLYCPLCGGTRAISSLIRGDLILSLIYNPAVLPALIAFVVYDVFALIAILKNKDKVLKIHKSVWISILAILIINWLVRNALLIIWDIDYIYNLPF